MRGRKFKKIRRKGGDSDIDITSLLDILVILLVFLLKSYSASDLRVELKDNIDLPSSFSQTLGSKSVIVQVNSSRKIWVNQKELGWLDTSGTRIERLFEELTRIGKVKDKNIAELSKRPELNRHLVKTYKNRRRNVNIILDQSLPYHVLRKVMHTSALAGFSEFKFIVQGKI